MHKGRIVEIYGQEASGKTTLALHIIKEAQKFRGSHIKERKEEEEVDMTNSASTGTTECFQGTLVSRPFFSHPMHLQWYFLGELCADQRSGKYVLQYRPNPIHLLKFEPLTSLLYTGSDDPGQRIAAATYLKNFTRRNIPSSKVNKEFRDALLCAFLQVDSAVLKVLVEVKVSRQEYLKKMEQKKLKELRDDMEDKQYLFDGVKLTEAEYGELSCS